MESIKFLYVPEHISESSELSLAAKKLLDALINYRFNSKACDTGKIFVSNNTLCKLAKIGHSQLLKSIIELKNYSLLDRVQGSEIGNASEYIIHFEKLNEPLKKKSFDEMFNRFMNKPSITDKQQQEPITTRIEVKILKDE